MAKEQCRAAHCQDVGASLKGIEQAAAIQARTPVGALGVPFGNVDFQSGIARRFYNPAKLAEECFVIARPIGESVGVLVMMDAYIIQHGGTSLNHCAVVRHAVAIVPSHAAAAASEQLDRRIDLLHQRGESQDFFGVFLSRCMPRLVVDFPEFDIVRLWITVRSTNLAPLRIGGTVAVLDPVNNILSVVMRFGVVIPAS